MAGQAFDAALRDAQLGRAEGFAILYQRHQPALLRTLLGLSPDHADQLAVETWRHVARDLAGYSGDEHGFRAWVITLGRLRLGDALRHTPRVRASDGQPGEGGGPGPATDPTTEAIGLVRHLPPAQAEAVLLRVVGGLDALTLADRMRSSHGDARALYCAGLVALSRRWTTPHADLGAGRASPPAATVVRLDAVASRLDPDRVEALLDDASFEPEGATEVRIADLVAVLRAPARESELVGEPAALAAYESTPPTRSRQRRAAQHTAMIVAVGFAVTLTTATAAAAVTGSLPRGVQELAHTLVGAPAPPPVSVVAAPPAPAPAAPSPSSVPAAPPTAAARPPMVRAITKPRLAVSRPAAPAKSTVTVSPTPSPSAAPSVSPSPSPPAPVDVPSPSPSTAPPTDPATTAPAEVEPASDPVALCQAWQAAQAAGRPQAPGLLALLDQLAGTPEQIQSYCDLTLGSASPTPAPSPPPVAEQVTAATPQASTPATGSSSEP